MENLSAFTKEDLERRLQRFLAELEELEEERGFVLKQTGLHLPGHTVKKYEAEIQGLKESIAQVRTEIALRS